MFKQLRSKASSFGMYLLVAILAFTAGQTGIVSAHGGDTALIHACVSKLNGTVKIMSAGKNCPSGYDALHWGIQGPKGDKGDPGEAGPAGPQGPGITRNQLYTVSIEVDIPGGETFGATAYCLDDNDVVLSGGHYYTGWWLTIVASEPVLNGSQQGWNVLADNRTLDSWPLTVSSLCLKVD